MINYEQDLVRIIVGMMIRAGKEDVVFTPEDVELMEEKFPEHSLVVEVNHGVIRAAMVKEGDKLKPLPDIYTHKIPNIH